MEPGSRKEDPLRFKCWVCCLGSLGPAWGLGLLKSLGFLRVGFLGWVLDLGFRVRLRVCVGFRLGIWPRLCSAYCLKRFGLGGVCSKLIREFPKIGDPTIVP